MWQSLTTILDIAETNLLIFVVESPKIIGAYQHNYVNFKAYYLTFILF